MPRRVLIYGDSNTWGYVPGGGRLPLGDRFPDVCQKVLGPSVLLLADGLPNRNAAFEGPGDPVILGGGTFAACLRDHAPLDAVAVILGTNDVMPPMDHAAERIATDLGRFVSTARGIFGAATPVLLIAPVPIAAKGIEELAAWYGGSRDLLRQDLAGPIEKEATRLGAAFWDAQRAVPEADASDGFHLTAKAHAMLGTALAAQITQLLSC